MAAEVQTIVTPSGEELVILPRSEYEALVSAIEDADDGTVLDARRDEPTLPHDEVMAILRGDLHPLAAWRKARGLTQAELGARAGVRGATISDIEAGKSAGRFDVMQRIAAALDVDLDDLATRGAEDGLSPWVRQRLRALGWDDRQLLEFPVVSQLKGAKVRIAPRVPSEEEQRSRAVLFTDVGRPDRRYAASLIKLGSLLHLEACPAPVALVNAGSTLLLTREGRPVARLSELGVERLLRWIKNVEPPTGARGQRVSRSLDEVPELKTFKQPADFARALDDA
jgi:transcriptional regulator with XRE-family HTH domain/antitoxin (DNA-binding transcriptional repressor) of toxin-antitoxin stability system